MIYVLSVFVLEPIRWIDRFEWRTMTAAERQSILGLWLHIGRRMGIRDIPANSLAELEAWNEQYEQQNMVYAASNVTIAEATLALFLSLVPSCLHGFGRRVAYCLMDARLRHAVGYPDPAPLLRSTLMATLWLRQTVIRHLCLPRPQWLSARRTPVTVAATGAKLCPRFHTYEATYRDGYAIPDLGDAPKGKTMPSPKCPVYAGSS